MLAILQHGAAISHVLSKHFSLRFRLGKTQTKVFTQNRGRRRLARISYEVAEISFLVLTIRRRGLEC